jgi:tetratricopeptide (TPR) repeat protein
MTNSKFYCAAVFLSVVLSLGGSHAFASSVLIRTSPHSGQSWSVQTYAGAAEVSASAVKPSSSITILILTDTLGAAENEQVRNDLLDLYGALRGRTIQIGFLSKDGAFTLPVAVGSRARLKQLLEKNVTGEGVQTVPSAVVLDDLIAAVPKLGPKQSCVLVVGEFPKVDQASTAFASALLIRAFLAQQLCASLFSPVPSEEWSAVFRSLAGESVTTSKDLPTALVGRGEAIMQLEWVPPAPPAGFVVANSDIKDEVGTPVGSVLDIAQADGVTLPSIQQYADAQKKIAEAESLLNEDLSQERADRIREDMAAALQLNSRDSGALLVATGLYEKAQDFPNAVKMASYLVEIGPRDGSAYARLGHELRLNTELDRADAALKKASELGVASLQLNEDFARLHLSRKNDSGALPYLQEVLRQDAKRQDIWFLQAQTAERTEKISLAEHSYEQGLGLGGVHVPESGSLLRLYVAGKQTDQATQLAKAQLASLPPSVDDRIQFAAVLDELRQSDLALQGWRAVLAVQPASERAHTRVARLLFEGGNAQGAEEEAISGLAVVPNSASLHLVKADAEEHLGRIYDARRTLQDGASTISDITLAAQLATLEERFFGGAPSAYARLAELSKPSSPDQLHALERGFDMSMRDGDLQQAAKFASSLESSGQKGYRALLGEEKTMSSMVMVPGGLNALAFTAHASKEEISPERFFLEYCRTLINGGVDVGKNEYIEGIREYFERIAELRVLGTSKAGEMSITLSLADKNARHQTEKALNILGIRLKSSKGEVELAQGEKKSQAIKQETAAALALDEVGIQEALQSGKPYHLKIQDEPASVYPTERIWRDALNLKNPESGGFAEELLRVPHMARTYVSLNSMDRAAAEELLKAFPLRELCDHESDLLESFAPALALEGNHAAVPGGAKAEPLWASLVGVSPANPGPFFRALIKHDDGKLLAYFSVLAQLDKPHQAFFTANERRVKQFYDLLTSTRQMKVRPYGEFQESGFQRMLRSVPLDEDGHIEFPGSAEVWTVAKGTSSDEHHTAHLMKKVRKAATPEVEDAVLARLTETQYKEKNAHLSELDNFLAVSSIDLHRKEPMDEESALLLAQKYAEYAAIYPYLTDLRTLTVED